MKLGNLTKDIYRRILIVGDSGSGKTTFAATAPVPFFADFDHGLDTLAGKNIEGEYQPYDTETFSDFWKELGLWRKEGPQYGCETFVLDSLTTVSEACLYSITKGSTPEIRDWMLYIGKMKKMLGYLTTLDCNVIVTGHLQIVKDDVTGSIERIPIMYGDKLPGQLPIYFNDVWYSQIETEPMKEASYRIQLKPDRKFPKTKCSLNIDKQFIDNPTFTKIMENSK